MKRYISVVSVTLVLLALGLTGSSAIGKEVPLKGPLEGTVTITPVAPPFIVDVLIVGTGNATHLGRFALRVPHRVNRADGTGHGTYEFTAANGDMLYADFDGVATMIAPGVFRIVETASITGGSGRFAGATGEFVVEREFEISSGMTAGFLEGTITGIGH